MPGESLTKKEQWVLEQLAAGMFLRDRKFSDLYEIGPTRNAAFLGPNNCVGSVNRRIVQSLQDGQFIESGYRAGHGQSTYVLTDKGRAAISSQKNIFASTSLSKVEK
jgi:hypothetical protein